MYEEHAEIRVIRFLEDSPYCPSAALLLEWYSDDASERADCVKHLLTRHRRG
jgi:hypothetical protein